ncbi:MAG: leucine-rich repeat domain-containing protein [Treponema sp.]|nr:leucine-rich repeat domain-containing protein [Treponema sp.]
MSEITSKNGLLYKDNFHTLSGIDSSSSEFKGRIPFGVHTIEDRVFAGTSYESVSIPESVKQVGFNLFENAVNTKSVRLPASLSELTPYMFSGCRSLSKITMPNIVSEFPEGIFMNCSVLPEVPFRTDIAYIGEKAFYGCSSVRSVAFPETVQAVASKAFAGCLALESVVIGRGLCDIADDAFENCSALCHIRLDEANPEFELSSDGSVVRKSDGKVIISVGNGQRTGVNFVQNSAPVPEEKLAVWIDEDDDTPEEDDFFSAEVGAVDEEAEAMGVSVQNEETSSAYKPSVEPKIEGTGAVQNNSKTGDIYKDILNQNTKVTEQESSEISLKVEELSGVVDALNAANGTYTEAAAEKRIQDRNISILCQNVGFSSVVEYPSKGVPASTSELFVFAENLITAQDGNKDVSPKLKHCSESLADIHDLKKIVYLSELPVENEEFLVFLGNMLKRQHVLVACDATGPASLSAYSKKLCEAAQISLNGREILEQRKRAGIKNPGTIKLIVQDKY